LARREEWEAGKLAKKWIDKPKPLLGKLPEAIARPKISAVVEVDEEEDEEEVNSVNRC
jgi:hypothetical protein